MLGKFGKGNDREKERAKKGKGKIDFIIIIHNFFPPSIPFHSIGTSLQNHQLISGFHLRSIPSFMLFIYV
jgi:hypothetical protein